LFQDEKAPAEKPKEEKAPAEKPKEEKAPAEKPKEEKAPAEKPKEEEKKKVGLINRCLIYSRFRRKSPTTKRRTTRARRKRLVLKL
jgi:outer membrane biosynthesis protein TonB